MNPHTDEEWEQWNEWIQNPDYGGTFQMNPGQVYLTDAEYQELIDAVKANL